MQSQSKIRYWQIIDGQDAICNNQFCYAQDSDANAAHIVKCVNMHEELVEALLGVVEQYAYTKQGSHVPMNINRQPLTIQAAMETLKKAGAL